MPDPNDERARELDRETDDDRRFSQDDDDRAGRSWHGMNSDVHEVGRFDEDEDETAEPAAPTGRTERV